MRRLLKSVLLTGGFMVLALTVTPALAAPALPLAGTPAAQADNWRCAEVNGQVGLNVRNGAGTAYVVVATLEPGTRVQVNDSRNQNADGFIWTPIQFGTNTGWAIASRLDACSTSATTVPAANAPSTQAGINHDGVLDHNEIALIARSVVLVANIQKNQVYATGTGTITSPGGLVITNAHVIDGADQVAIGVLDNINDPPQYRYLGTVVQVDKNIDVALIAIRSDMNGNSIDTSTLNLPYIASTLKATDVFRGDRVYIFGYPRIGDDYLVVTEGTIVSVEDGMINGQRLPVWYRTDAEISPGNSGGLAVSGNGDFIGIPTFVQTEQQTGGRLGGIRPAEVAVMAVMGGHNASTAAATPAPPSGGGSSVALPVSFTFKDVRLQHGTVVDGESGITFHVAFTVNGWAKQDATLYARFYTDDLASAPLTNPNAPGQYRDKQNIVLTSLPIQPCCEETVYDDLPLFIPYSAFGISLPGSYPLKVQIEVRADDQSWHYTLSWEFIKYTLK